MVGLQMVIVIFMTLCSICGKATGDTNVSVSCNDRYCFPRVVWSHWNDSLLPDDVEEMVSISRESFANFTYYFLTNENVSDFLDVNTFPHLYSTLRVANKADYTRVCLLAKYGGIWIDSTTYILSGNEMEWFFSELIVSKREIIGFPTEVGRKELIMVSFFAAPENSSFMRMMKKEYDIALGDDIVLYVERVCEEIFPCMHWGGKHCLKKYFLMYLIFAKTMCSSKSFSETVYKLPEKHSPELLLHECSFRITCIKQRLLQDPVARGYLFIKLWHKHRNGERINLRGKAYNSKVRGKDL